MLRELRLLVSEFVSHHLYLRRLRKFVALKKKLGL